MYVLSTGNFFNRQLSFHEYKMAYSKGKLPYLLALGLFDGWDELR